LQEALDKQTTNPLGSDGRSLYTAISHIGIEETAEPSDETKSPSLDEFYININHGDSLIATVRRATMLGHAVV
jgi:hypothetical protein